MLTDLNCSPTQFLEVDKFFSSQIRIFSFNQTTLNGFTTTRNILEDGKKFLQLLNILSLGQFLVAPCRLTDHGIGKVSSRNRGKGQFKKKRETFGTWTEPGWLKYLPNYTMGTYVTYHLEITLWKSFWRAKPHLNPSKLCLLSPPIFQPFLILPTNV